MLGRFLFRWRGVIGLAAFGVVFWLARPTFGSCFVGVPFLLVGLALRFWASGYIGIEGRVREIGGSWRIVDGPYRLLRHPLYIGNALLVVGMLAALRPGTVVRVGVMVGFVLVYALIVVEEERELSRGRSQRLEKREAGGERREARGDGPKSMVGSPESTVQRPESFLLSRALCEWRTWVVTGVAFGLAVAKAAVRS